jgi:hypothetical protein
LYYNNSRNQANLEIYTFFYIIFPDMKNKFPVRWSREFSGLLGRLVIGAVFKMSEIQGTQQSWIVAFCPKVAKMQNFPVNSLIICREIGGRREKWRVCGDCRVMSVGNVDFVS